MAISKLVPRFWALHFHRYLRTHFLVSALISSRWRSTNKSQISYNIFIFLVVSTLGSFSSRLDIFIISNFCNDYSDLNSMCFDLKKTILLRISSASIFLTYKKKDFSCNEKNWASFCSQHSSSWILWHPYENICVKFDLP